MFDPTEFEKLQQQLSNQLEKTAEKFRKAFQSLPNAVRQAFDPSFAARFEKAIDAISDATGETIKELEKALDVVKRQAKILEDQAQAIQDQITNVRAKAREDQKIVKELLKQAKTQNDITAALQMQKDIEKQKLATVRKLANVLNAVNAAQAGAAAKQNALNIQLTQAKILQQQGLATQRAFGKTFPQLINQAKQFGQTWFNTRGIITGISLGIGLLVKQMANGYQALRKQGFDSYQAFTHMDDVLMAQASGAAHGVIASNKEFAAGHGGLANQLGQTDVNRGAVIESTRLSTQFGLSNDAATHLVGQMNRIHNFQAKAANESLRMARALADANKIPVGTMMKDLAEHSEAVALYAGRGTAALAKSLIVSRQMGVEFKSLSGFADRLVDDFEGSLKMQAQIQTILPGMDLSEVMYAAQFGNEDQVGRAMKSALHSTGLKTLDQLPRSVRNMLIQGTGFSAEELQNMLGERSAEEKGTKTDISGYSDTARAFGNSIGDMITNSKLATNALGLLAMAASQAAMSFALRGGGAAGAMAAARAGGAGWGGSLLAGVKGGAGGAALGGLGAGLYEMWNSRNQGAGWGRTLGRSLITGAGGALGALAGSFIPIPGIGTMLGGAAGGWLGGKAADWLLPVQPNQMRYTEGYDDLNKQISKSQAQRATDQPDHKVKVDTVAVEKKLDELIKATKQKQSIVMDGKKVGEVIVNANARN